MQCSSCGNVLSPGVRICPACGALAPLPPPIILPPLPARTTSFYDEQIPFTDRGTPVKPPSLPFLPALPALPAPPEPPIRPGKMDAAPLPPPPITAPPSRPSRLIVLTSTGFIAALLIIVVLTILLVRATAANNASSANKRATQTSSSGTNDPQALYSQVMNTKPVLDDGFNSINGGNWISGTATEGSTCTVTSDTLQATATQGNSSLCALSTANVSNFACQVQTTLTQGDSIGLIFRANTTTLHIYVLEINAQGAYTLESGQGTTAPKSLSHGSSSALKMGYGQPNLLTIIGRGSTIYIYFNKQFIAHVNDNSSSSGLVGVLSSGSISNVPVNATFSHFQLWNL